MEDAPQERNHAASLSPQTAAAAMFCCLLWAGAYVTAKFAIGTPEGAGFGPFRLAFFRFGIAGILLFLWGWWRDRDSLRLRRDDWPAFGRLALLGMCLTYTFNYAGLALSTGTAAALIMATEPVWIALLAVLILKERMTGSRFAGIVFGLAGALIVVLSTARPGTAGDAAGNVMLGNLLMVLSLLWEAGAVLTVKRLTQRYSGRTIVTYEFLLGTVLLAPFAAWEQAHAMVPLHPSPVAWWSFAYLLIGCTLIAYTLWFQLLERTDASVLTVFIFLQPVVGTLIGVVFLHDPFTGLTLLGALLVLVAVLAITRPPRRTTNPPPPYSRSSDRQ